MKKSKFLTLTVFVLLFSIILCSCTDNNTKTLDLLFNAEYEPKSNVFKSAEEISVLEGYTPVYTNSDKIAILEKRIDTSYASRAYTAYKVYNLLTKSVVLEIGDKDSTYTIKGFASCNIFTVQKTTTKTGSNLYIAYDLAGNKLAHSQYSFSNPTILGDFVAFNRTLYRPDADTGKLEEAIDVDSYSIPYFDSHNRYQTVESKHIYYLNSSSVTVYAPDFTQIYYYTAPSYLTSVEMFVLNDGKILGQGYYITDSDATDYDFYTTSNQSTTIKNKVYQFLIDPFEKTVREIDLGCLISQVKTSYELRSNHENVYGEGFENIAYTHPIVDKKIDTSAPACDIMLMDNNAKLSSSLKLIDGQKATLPKKLTNERYLVDMLGGSSALITKNGDVIAANILSPVVVGDYIISNNAIYDFDMNLIYDTRDVSKEITANIYGASESFIFISESTENVVTYYIIKNGGKQQIGQISTENADSLKRLRTTECGYYLQVDSKYVFRNFNGDTLFESNSVTMEVAAHTDDLHLIVSGNKVYLISK